MIMASVCLAAIKIGGVMLGLDPVETVLIASVVTVVYSSGRAKGRYHHRFFSIYFGHGGYFWAAHYLIGLPQIGSLEALLTHPNAAQADFIPDLNQRELFITLFVLPIAVQWWSVWYPGAEPGEGVYCSTYALSQTKNMPFGQPYCLMRRTMPYDHGLDHHRIGLPNYFPDLEAIQAAFPAIDPKLFVMIWLIPR